MLFAARNKSRTLPAVLIEVYEDDGYGLGFLENNIVERHCFGVFVMFAVSVSSTYAQSTDPDAEWRDFFEQKIRPVLIQHCYTCHSSVADPIEGGLQLDFRDGVLKGGSRGPAVLPGKPDESILLKAIRYEELEMPPSGQLPARVIDNFRKWIQKGAVDPRDMPVTADSDRIEIDYDEAREFWSFRPLSDPSIPKLNAAPIHNPIDRFIFQKQRQAGISLGKTASATVLLRRAYFDLIGLPPGREMVLEVREGMTDSRYETLVDQLLEDLRFGEHWARHWLDLARFAESSGFEQDQPRPDAWPYRDFVIQAFNEDMPYDEFIRLQLAGDQIHPEDIQANVATGFLVAGVENLIQSRKEFERERYDKLDDFVSTVGTGMLGLTIGCSRCHDHKYDPITQRDYYHFAAAFRATISATREFKNGDRITKSYVAQESAEDRIRMVTVSEPSFEDLPTIPAEVHFLIRGDVNNKREVVQTGFPVILNPQPASLQSAGRVELAEWITNTQSGAGHLLARVIVNRLWHHYFGRGIVSTPSDFGTRGALPTHPELLDWLAGELIRNEWRLKTIHKLIVMSATYRQAFRTRTESEVREGGGKPDLENSLFWKREPRRIAAEAIRDSLLRVSGRLESTMYGPGTPDQNSLRRSVYLTVRRSQLIPVLQLFDAPDAVQGLGARQSTTTAPQALMMLNNPFVLACVQSLRSRVESIPHRSNEEFLRNGFLLVLGRVETAEERAIALRVLGNGEKEQKQDFFQMLVCLNEFFYIE